MSKKVVPVGIDVGAGELVVAIGGSEAICKFPNNGKGRQNLMKTLKKEMNKRVVKRARIVLEATGIYSLPLSLYLHGRDEFDLHVLNPAQARSYAQSRLARSKTDAEDARVLADLAAHHDDLPVWSPPPDLQLELRSLISRRNTLIERMTALKNQEHAESFNPKSHPDLKRSHKREHTFLEKEIAHIEKLINDLLNSDPSWSNAKKNLESIPGVGPKVSSTVLAIIGADVSGHTVKEVVALAGLDPSEHQSGTSVHKKPRISKKGNALLRRSLYWAALVGIQHNPILMSFYEKLLNRGKIKKVALIACVRKILHIIFGVLKNRQPFNPFVYMNTA